MDVFKRGAVLMLVVVSCASRAGAQPTGTIDLAREARGPVTVAHDPRDAGAFTAWFAGVLAGGTRWRPAQDADRLQVAGTETPPIGGPTSTPGTTPATTTPATTTPATTTPATTTPAATTPTATPAATMPAVPAHFDPVALAADPTTCGDAMGCFQAGFAFDQGQGVAVNYELARRLYERSCELDGALGCLNLGVLLATGNLGRVDTAPGMALYKKACALDARVACGDIASRYFLGFAVEVDIAQAEVFATRGCKVGRTAHSCTWLGRVYKKQGKTDAAEALFRLVCDARDGDACKHLGDLLVEKNAGMDAILAYQKAASLLHRRCVEERSPITCSTLATIHEQGLGVPVSAAKAAEAKAIACAASKRYCAP